MSDEPTKPAASPRWRKIKFLGTLLVVVLAVLMLEAFYYSFAPLDQQQKALMAWQGVRAPDFTVTNLDGQTVRLADLKGKRVILNFWATWCGPCQAEVPDFIKLRTETLPANVFILGLSTDDAATQRIFAQRNGINYPLAMLQSVPSPYADMVKIPVTLVIDRNGVIQEAVLGPQDLKTLEKFASEADYTGAAGAGPLGTAR